MTRTIHDPDQKRLPFDPPPALAVTVRECNQTVEERLRRALEKLREYRTDPDLCAYFDLQPKVKARFIEKEKTHLPEMHERHPIDWCINWLEHRLSADQRFEDLSAKSRKHAKALDLFAPAERVHLGRTSFAEGVVKISLAAFGEKVRQKNWMQLPLSTENNQTMFEITKSKLEVHPSCTDRASINELIQLISDIELLVAEKQQQNESKAALRGSNVRR